MSKELDDMHFELICPALARLRTEAERVANDDYNYKINDIRAADGEFQEARKRAEYHRCTGPQLEEENGVLIAHCPSQNKKWPLNKLPKHQQEGIIYMSSLAANAGKTAIRGIDLPI